ncbi:hypothetical protein L226DRAFT_124011 [Lentinus tigrinus ALCF2SS1-7]|uniref:uncharacterized protein n=1 Tax=Lentinus tigrinus ALCF2SS1-7 TaxID=1328758 RepID=UPI00116600D8|nr:hypothetical protein L226DRAFT_124011 [Lentinus tigrinus ALCF2SS1-7]
MVVTHTPLVATTRARPVMPKPKIHPCDWTGCRAAFGRNADMVRHRKTVHQHIKEYICGHPHCRKAFSQQASLKTHIRTHTREKPYKCAHPRCRQAFGDQSSCSRHFRDIHSGRTHFCPWCNSTNKRSGEFRKHLDKMHHIERNAVEIKIYQLPETLKVEDLERLPQFMGLPGLEMRRKMPGRSRRHAPQSASSADILQNPGRKWDCDATFS